MMYRINIWLYPLLEMASIASAILFLPINYIGSFLFILLAAFFMNFALHISIHAHVHFPISNRLLNRITDFWCSVLSGIPFHYYKMNHWNHHKHNNSLEDFTTTWKLKDGKVVPKNFLSYTIFWFRSSGKDMKAQQEQAMREGYFTDEQKRKMNFEALFLLLIHLSLWIFFPMAAVLYLLLIYFGWCLIALHNYGQHLPDYYQKNKGLSYYGKLYNFLFMNNGLHEEHHEQPQLKYGNLRKEKSKILRLPHLIAPILHPSKATKNES